MLTSTVALAAAANYPAPFISKSGGDVGIVYGSSAAATDFAAVVEINSHLTQELAKMTAPASSSSGVGSSATIEGEAAGLFSGSSKLYVNSTLNAVKSVLTDTELPVALKDGTFSGDVTAKTTQRLVLGGGTDSNSHPQVRFTQETSSTDSVIGLQFDTSETYPLYNASVTFNKAVNLTHADSTGEELTMFGQEFTISSSTDSTNLVLLKSAEKVNLDTDNPTAEVTVGGATYTVELISASDSAATVQITNADGVSASKEVNQDSSKRINDVTVAVTAADETNLKLSATVIVGAEKVTLTDGSAVTLGEDNDAVDGTRVTLTGGIGALTELLVSVRATSSDDNFLEPGEAFVDPVFGSFKLDFPSMNIADESDDREMIEINPSGNDKATVTFMDHSGNEGTVQFARNLSSGVELQHDSNGRNISVIEMAQTYRSEYIVLGNEDEGHIVKVSTITNQSTGYSNDKVSFTDVLDTTSTFDATLTAEGTGTVTIGGKVYTVTYSGDSSSSEDSRWVRLNYPDSSGASAGIVYPTVQTKKGAKVTLYEPLTNVTLNQWDGNIIDNNTLTSLRFPDGDGYTDVTFSVGDGKGFGMNITIGGTTTFIGGNATAINVAAVSGSIGQLTYNFTYAGINRTAINLVKPEGGNIAKPAILVFEEKDDNSIYHAVIATIEGDGTSTNGIGVDDVSRTWHADSASAPSVDSLSEGTNTNIKKEADIYGTIITTDEGDSDQKKATISYPDEQVYALLYIAGVDSTVDTGVVSSDPNATTSTSTSVKVLGSVQLADSDAAQAADKNLIVVGGSCINSVAAGLLGGSLCGSDFESKTNVGSGSFLIETFSRTGGKVATLVAGYNAGDTVNAARYLTTQPVDTSVGKKYVGTSATSATLVTEAAAEPAADDTTDDATDADA